MVKLKLHGIWFHAGGKNAHNVKIPRHATGYSDPADAAAYLEKLKAATQWPLPEDPKPEPPKEKLTLADALEKWLESLDLADDSTSRDTYRRNVRNAIIKPMAALTPPVTLLEEVTSEHLIAQRNDWRRRGLAFNTIRTYRDHSGSMFKWGVDYGHIKRNPWKIVKTHKAKRPGKDETLLRQGKDQGIATLPLDTTEGKENWLRIQTAAPGFVKARQGAAKNPLFQDPRTFPTMLEMMYETGLRRSDSTVFRPDWIDTTETGGSYFCIQWKTGDPVTCYLPHELTEALRNLPLLPWRGSVARYEKLAKKPFVPGAGLYPFYDGSCKSLDVYMEGNLNTPMREFGETLGFSVENKNSLRPHRFRDSFAVNMLNLGLSLQDIKVMLGHRRLITTETYYARYVLSVGKAIERRQAAARQAQRFQEAVEAPRARAELAAFATRATLIQ